MLGIIFCTAGLVKRFSYKIRVRVTLMERKSLEMQLEQGWKWAVKAKWWPAKRLWLREPFDLEKGSAAFSTASPEKGELGLRESLELQTEARLERDCQKEMVRRPALGEISGLQTWLQGHIYPFPRKQRLGMRAATGVELEGGCQDTWDGRHFYPCNAWGSLSKAQQENED